MNKNKTLNDYIYDFLKVKAKEKGWSLTIQDIMFMLLGDFVTWLLHEQNVEKKSRLHIIHLENFLHEHIDMYRESLEETLRSFFEYVKEQRNVLHHKKKRRKKHEYYNRNNSCRVRTIS